AALDMALEGAAARTGRTRRTRTVAGGRRCWALPRGNAGGSQVRSSSFIPVLLFSLQSYVCYLLSSVPFFLFFFPSGSRSPSGAGLGRTGRRTWKGSRHELYGEENRGRQSSRWRRVG